MISIEFFRQFQVFGYAVFDLIAATLGMYLLGPILSKLFLKIHIKIPRLNWVFLTLPIGIVVHLAVGNITPMTRDFFDIEGFYILKILILSSFILGFKNIKFIKTLT